MNIAPDELKFSRRTSLSGDRLMVYYQRDGNHIRLEMGENIPAMYVRKEDVKWLKEVMRVISEFIEYEKEESKYFVQVNEKRMSKQKQ